MKLAYSVAAVTASCVWPLIAFAQTWGDAANAAGGMSGSPTYEKSAAWGRAAAAAGGQSVDWSTIESQSRQAQIESQKTEFSALEMQAARDARLEAQQDAQRQAQAQADARRASDAEHMRQSMESLNRSIQTLNAVAAESTRRSQEWSARMSEQSRQQSVFPLPNSSRIIPVNDGLAHPAAATTIESTTPSVISPIRQKTTESQYESKSGLKYEYDLSRPTDQIRYSTDLKAQIRDENEGMRIDPRRDMQKEKDAFWGQQGGGIQPKSGYR